MTDERSYRDEETLREMYLEQEMTTREIADELGCTNGTISRWLENHDIPTRENWKAGVEAAAEANRVERVKMRLLNEKHPYECWPHKEWEDGDRVSKVVYVHRLLAVAEYGFDAVADMDVHHENNIPWDNRPDNISPVNKSDHGTYHTNQRWGNETEDLSAETEVSRSAGQTKLSEYTSASRVWG